MSESLSTWTIVAMVAGAGLLLTILTLVAFTAMVWLFARLGGWGRLVARFPASAEPPGRLLRGQTIKAGSVRYRRCVAVGLGPEGMMLQVQLPAHPPVWIPWSELHSRRDARLYWYKAVGLLAGRTDRVPLVFPARLFAEIEPYLRD